ncbi:beta-ketoacyl-[acyl-carrier-protein] synthase family protein [Pseudohoeflea coraliihabitans]|uniref:Nodulation protein E n=1 Tax=Pseudohoeflea coraliihabitans TaxID=2860393 RepID=A0ABS6WT83_9HYPH|nr:beta-ketoacyl-[acyl-carrier-protein] synthase family protein [Pseudohoeflea sp. DP4N28-3]MBW3099171.1 beta-ketoacyl-[acyl-carrier-protein] synthase family protein [Pseudohoeflea sp. DP4N28-3]
MTHQRIVITGLGGVCSLGSTADDIWQAMKAGRDGSGEVPITDRKLRNTMAFPITDKLEDDGIDPRRRVTMGEFSRLAVIAAQQAMTQAGLQAGAFDDRRAGAVVGTGIYGTDAVDQSYFDILEGGKKRTHIFTVPRAMPGAPAGQVSMHCGLRGPVFGITSACTSGNHALVSAADQIRLGRADIMFAGGTDTPLTFGIIKAWEALRVLARTKCRPFSANRDGLLMGDGAGMAILETYEHARARGATILAEILGCGMSGDASDIVNPTVEGPALAIENCLRDAGLSGDAVGYINAHGTGTQANDKTETKAIRVALGAAADGVSVSSTKSMHGHCLGGSSALEVIACVGALREGIIPPTINYEAADPDCDLDVTPNVARQRPIEVAISNAFAFGGTNAVIAFGKV